MGNTTSIAWTDATWSPVTGCANDTVRMHLERLDIPLHWRKPRRVFVCSVADLFHEQVPDEFLDRVFGAMLLAPQHTYQVLTKRIDRALAYLTDEDRPVYWQSGDKSSRPADTPTKILWAAQLRYDELGLHGSYPFGDDMEWPLPNVWLGTSVENQEYADMRLPILARVPARVRFVSCEPLMGPLDLRQYLLVCGYPYEPCDCKGLAIHQVIVGGERRPGHRPMDLDWARSLRDQCQAAGVAFFFNQVAGPRPGMDPVLDGREWKEMP